MRLTVCYRGDPIAEADSLVEAYLRVRDEFRKRWPRAFYGPQEAAAHGFTIIGKPELTPEEARQLRADLHRERDAILQDVVQIREDARDRIRQVRHDEQASRDADLDGAGDDRAEERDHSE